MRVELVWGSNPNELEANINNTMRSIGRYGAVRNVKIVSYGKSLCAYIVYVC